MVSVVSFALPSLCQVPATAPQAPAPDQQVPETAPQAPVPAPPGPTAEAKRMDLEVQYVSGLIQLGFPDFAKKASDALAKTPGFGARLRALEIQSLILQKKYDEAKKLIATLDLTGFDFWPAMLEAADAYYQMGMWSDAQLWYDRFFKTFTTPPAGKEDFYKGSAYKYSQMLKYMKNDEKAYEVYGYALKANPLDEEKAQMWTEMSQIAVRVAMNAKGDAAKDKEKRAKYIKLAKDCAEGVQWMGGEKVPIWFGKTLVIYAQIEALNGDNKKAMTVIKSNLEILSSIHEELLKTEDEDLIKLTPMAECRFVLGSLYHDDGMALIKAGQDKDGLRALAEAVNHLYNVFSRYPKTAWAPMAGKRVWEIFDYFDSRKIKYSRPPESELLTVVRIQTGEAKMVMQSGDYEGAVKKYSEILTVFPEFQSESPYALGNLAECYYQLKEPDCGKAVSGYIVERFNKKPRQAEAAANAIFILAAARKDAKDEKVAGDLFDSLIENFPQHPQYSVILLQRGEVFRTKGDFDVAMRYYEKLKPGDRGYESALSSMASVWHSRKNYDKEIETLKKYIDLLKPGYDRNHAQCRLALASMTKGDILAGAKEYETALEWIRDPKTVLLPAEQTENRKLFEMAICNTAGACAQIREPLVPAADVAKYQRRAVTLFDEFANQFPGSADLAAKALSKEAIILQVILKESEQAAKTFELLGKRYPNSPEAKERYYVQVRALLEMGYVNEAKKSVEGMLGNPGSYTAAQFYYVAKALLEHKENELAIKVYTRIMSVVKDKDKDRAMIEGSIFSLGELYFKLARYPEAAISLRQLFNDYPNTGYTVDAALMLSQACCEVGSKEKDLRARSDMFNEGMSQLNKITGLLGGPLKDRADEMRAKIAFEVGRIYELRARVEDTFGQSDAAKKAREQANAAFFRLFKLFDPKKPGVSGYMEDAFKALIPYEIANERHSDVIELCKRYTELFNGGKYAADAERWQKEAKDKGGSEAGEQAGDTNVVGAVAPPPTNTAVARPAVKPESSGNKGTNAPGDKAK